MSGPAFIPPLVAVGPVAAGSAPAMLAPAAPVAPWDAPFDSPGVGHAAGSPGAFGTMVSDGLAALDQQVQGTQADLRQLASGQVENLHQVMIRLEEARLSFQLMLQVRNRLLESYQDVMRMQV